MNDGIDLEYLSMDWNSYATEVSLFEQDVYMLILTGLDAAIKLLKTNTQAEDDKLMVLPQAKGEAAEHLFQEQADIWIQLSQQEVFLRNQALVALMSRLTHTLHNMLRFAEPWAPRVPSPGDGRNEFSKMWLEIRHRFGLELSASYVDWVERYRRARNRIVHNGGEANLVRPFDEIDIDAGVAGMYDLSFSRKYPTFVNGEGGSAQIVISEKLLNYAVEKAVRLVKYLSSELRKLELAHRERMREIRRTADHQQN